MRPHIAKSLNIHRQRLPCLQRVYLLFLLGSALWLISVSMSMASTLSRDSNSDIFHRAATLCSDFLVSIPPKHNHTWTAVETDTWSSELTSALQILDHVYILTTAECGKVQLASSLGDKVSCISGLALDKCLTRRYTVGKQKHALKVTFSHAFIVHLASQAKHRSVAILESDALLIPHASFTFETDLRALLESNNWNIIRLGYRPYFLQESGTQKCPSACRCKMDLRYGPSFCRLRGPSCDIRSSDFYVLHQRVFRSFKDKLMDLRLQQRRIIDLAPIQGVDKQWLLTPSISFQTTLDIPVAYQKGLNALYVKKCVGPKSFQGTEEQLD